jgi:filamentous hemagglutinin
MSTLFSIYARRFSITAPGMVALVLAVSPTAQARNLIGVASSSSGSSASGSAYNAANSQTATAATTAAAQAAQAAVTTRRAQDSLVQSTAVFQSLAQAQLAANAAAEADLNNNLGSAQNPINGLQVGGLNPIGGVPTAKSSSAIQVVDLGNSGKNQLTLGNGGSVTLPSGTSGTDKITVSGAGSVTTAAGTVTVNAGSLSTTAGGTLSATNGGSISLTAGSGTLSTTTSATITSSLAGTVTISGGATLTLAANQSMTVPAGSTVKFTGTGTATVAVSGAGTLTLAGSGTLALSNATTSTGGTISTSSGTTSFTGSGSISSQAPGTTINLSGNGSLDFAGSGSDVLPVILQPTLSTQAPPAFTTTGTVLSTLSYNLPAWTGVGALSQSVNGSNNQTTVTITQDQPQALLNWLTFNVGKNTVLDFDQSAGGASVGDWVAINRILDPSLAPSQILGAIEAPGQVYVINQNGIIFGGSAQVNTHALVASTLPINSNLVANGLLNNPDGQFLFTSLAIPSLNGSTPYDPNSDPNALPNVTSGNIAVDEGAVLSSPGSPEGVGGKIALIAPTIDNEGTLSSPDGQIILAAGQQVGFVAHPSSDPSLRGLDVAIGQVNGNESVTNGVNGLIYAPEADVTMTAPTVNQNGVIESTTSVSLNGRIDLLAVSGLTPDSGNSYLFDSIEGGTSTGGVVNLGPNSLTEILPDYASTETQAGTSLALPSQVYVAGGTFHMGNGAQLIAPGATATLSVGILNTPIATATGETTIPLPENTGASTLEGEPNAVPLYLSTPGQLTLDASANLDVSGSSGVQASVTENIVSAELTEAVLENSSLQESGPLRGQTITVDVSQTGTNADGSVWYGSPIGDLSGYANLVEHTVGELTIAGGSVAINTNGSVVTNPTSSINVSGGSIDYQGATVQTTTVVAADGQILNIAQATPNQAYLGIDGDFTVTSPKWGVTQSYSNALQSGTYYDAGYVQGGSGGSFTINTQAATLGGALYGNITTGARQQLTPPALSTFGLSISNNPGQNPPTVNVIIQSSADAESSDPSMIYLSPDLFGADGFGKATINTGSGDIDPTSSALRQGSTIDVTSDTSISMAAGGTLSLTSANIDIEGRIDVPSGTVTVTALAKDTLDTQQSNATGYLPSIGNLEIGSSAVIATTGLTFDETSSAAPATLPYSVNGGTVTLAGAVTTLAAGSSVDASAGAIRTAAAKILSGKSGTLNLTGLYNGADGDADGALVLDGSLSAYGIGQGGTLNLKAPAVVVGSGSVPAFPSTQTPLILPENFFSQGGFANFTVTGSGGVQILTGATIAPVPIEEIVDGNGEQFGIDLISSAQLPQYPATPVNLTFSAPGAGGDAIATLTLNAGASITTGPTGTVTLTGQLVDILGHVTAPGGTITVTGDSTGGLGGDIPGTFASPDVSVYLGPQAALSVNGQEITTPTPMGGQIYHTGEILNGGIIDITGNIVGDTNASLQADGAVGALDVPIDDTGIDLQSYAFQRSLNPYVHETLASNGGSISLNGLEELYYNGSVSAKPGNASAIGGVLTVGSGVAATYTQPPDAGYPELFISPDTTFTPTTVTLGQPLLGAAANGGGYFAIKQFNDGSFGSLILNGNVEFENGTSAQPISITASQEVEIVPDSLNGTVFADGSNETISITAPYIAIGATSLNFNGVPVSSNAPSYTGGTESVTTTTVDTATNTTTTTSTNKTLPASPVPGLADPTYGAAQLNLNASDLIDVGFLSLQNIGTTTLDVPTGDIRGGGLFYAAGVISLQAGQIYTSTASTFTMAAFDNGAAQPGTINITDGVSRPLPLSAGGTIDVYATDINQDGVLEAPFGTINLGALPDPTTGLTPVLATVLPTLNNTTQEYIPAPDYNQYAPQTKVLTLGKNSITSVSGVSSTGQALDLPYGTILNGGQWIAPNGADITAGGLPVKAVNLEGNTVIDSPGSLVDLAGGGDLFAYQFSPGVGGTNDILNIYKYADGAIVVNSANQQVASTSFAIVPDYGINYSPIDLTVDSNLNNPYANASLTNQVGNEVYLAGGDGLAAGEYAILPARYALLPGAYLVTPTTGATPATTSVNPDGSLEMAGYLNNTLNPNQQIVPNVTGFEVDSSTVVHSRAEYDISSANTFLKASAIANNQPVPRLPVDAGQLVFSATTGLDIQGSLSGQAGPGGLGSTVDIGSTDDIYIVSTPSDTPTLDIPNGVSSADYAYLTLSANELDQLGAGSLLIGGTRASLPTGTTIDPTTNAIYVQNDSASPLTGNEIILVSKQTLTLDAGASIQQTGVASSGQENLTIGSATIPGSGDGTLIRVTDDPDAQFTRLGVNTADTSANLTIGAGTSIGGVAVTLDSSSGAVIDPTAVIDPNGTGQALVLSSGAISLQIDPNVSLASAPGLVIGNGTLQTLESSAERLSLSSYSTINLYGAGTLGALDSKGQPVVQNLSLQGAGIFGYDANGGTVTFNAQTVSINNSGNQTLPAAGPSAPTGLQGNSLVINANTINLGANTFAVAGYSTTTLDAANDILAGGTGSLNVQGGLNLMTPLVTASTGANFTFNAQGALSLTKPSTPGTSTATGGLGATLSFTGSSVTLASTISTPTGTIDVSASTGDIEVQSGGDLKASGQSVTFGNVIGYTNGGQVNLTSGNGDVILDTGSMVNVSALPGGANAGTINIAAANGTLSLAAGSVQGSAGASGTGGTFNAELGQVTTFSDLTTPVTGGGFQSLAFDVETGSVTVDAAIGPALTQNGLTSFSLTTEQGGITVNGTINASGVTGGTIDLYANQGITVNAALSVAGQQFDTANEGGVIDIETRGAGPAGSNSIVIASTATLNLSVDGGAGGVLHLRAPQTAGGTDLQIDPIAGQIVGASSVVLEGYQVYTPANGTIDSTLEGSATNNGAGTIYGDAQTFANNTDAILTRVLGLTTAPTAAQTALYQVTPGAEIINPTGSLTLATDWDLSSFRFGPNNVAGVLTLRAANNLVFTGSLTDGFSYNANDGENVQNSPYTWDVMSGPSWTYRLVAGAQFTAGASTANFGLVQSLTALGLDTNSLTNASLQAGSLLLGQNIPAGTNFGTQTALTASTYAQLIRTGTGDITIDTGGSVDLLNQLATIYTAGELAPTLAGFDSPTGTSDSKYQTKVYGTTIDPAPQYTAQYTEGGGNVSINAQQDIAHLTLGQDANGNAILVPDTSWQFPTNWLYRRGATSSTDVFDTTKLNTSEVATTTWWIDFSNFFEGIGALGGGNVLLNAGGNIVNVDAVVPTNARMPYADASGNPLPDVATNLVELGGGNLSVVAGGTIEGGTYYVEQGTGTIDAGSITSAGDTARISGQDLSLGQTTPLPLTLFVGNSSFTVEATNDLTIGSTVNPFLLPQGIGNNFNNESIFSTYGANSSVSLSSLLGTIKVQGSEFEGNALAGSLYNAYLSNASPGGLQTATFTSEQNENSTFGLSGPWSLTLDPGLNGPNFIDDVSNYSTFFALSPPTFRATAFSGSIAYESDQLLSPSAQGTLQLLAAGSVDGAFASPSIGNGLTASITVLDDDPSQLPSVTNPFGLGHSTAEPRSIPNDPSISTYISDVFALIGEAPTYEDQSFTTLESYHTPGLLHADSTTPIQIDTIAGDIGDFTLISPEEVNISSGLDLQDVSFYIQNNNATDISTVTANRDITLYDPNSTGLIALDAANSFYTTFGDLQISGPGTLEVLAGRNLDLGEGTSENSVGTVGTGLGITSIGNSRDPFLSPVLSGANIIAAAGIGDTSGLTSNPQMFNFAAFENEFLEGPLSGVSARYLPDLGALLGLTGASNSQISDIYSNTPDSTLTAQELQIQTSLTPEARDALATTIFYDVLRDAGRDHNLNGSDYTEGYAAIQALFPTTNTYQGAISLTSREIKTTNDGDINLLVPGGGIDVGLNNLGTQAIDQGILTVDGGNISIFANNDIAIGTSRIFTLHGGNIIIWSTVGDIDAGASSRTVQSAPPTRVLVDSQSANVQTDLAGLATGGGIGVLETVIGAPPGNVDLIAPVGTVNAGDAGIRSSGNINVAAAQVLNANNIQAAGSSTGVPTSSVPNISAAVAAASAGGASQNAANAAATRQQPSQSQQEDLPSIISVEVIGYGGDDSADAGPRPDRNSSDATYMAARP